MVVIQCPECGTQVEAEPGTAVSCPQCGFYADYRSPGASRPIRPVPQPEARPTPAVVSPAAPPASRPPPEPTAQAVDAIGESPKTVPGPWAYVLGVVALATFWAAHIAVPFGLGAAAIVLGILSRRHTPADKRGWPAIALGAAAIVAAGAFLAV